MKEINPRTLISLTNAHAVRGRPTLKDIQRNFRNVPVHELKVLTDLTSSYEISHDSNDQNITQSYNTDKTAKTVPFLLFI